MPRDEGCGFVHCEPQIQEEDITCPRCSAGLEAVDGKGILIEASLDIPDFCDLLHPNDDVICSNCDYYASAKQFTKDWKERREREDCPHCDAKGYIKKGGVVEVVKCHPGAILKEFFHLRLFSPTMEDGKERTTEVNGLIVTVKRKEE